MLVIEKFSTGGEIRHNITSSGTAYHEGTAHELVTLLEHLREARKRVRIYYGNPHTGEDWSDCSTGYIGRTMGPIRIPLIVHNRRSLGGPALLDNCIIRIEHANKRNGGAIWQAN